MNVMGRQSGFIAMQASMASGIVDCCLIPEINFSVDKVNDHIEKIIERKGHCVICIAEGCGQVETYLHSCAWSVVGVLNIDGARQQGSHWSLEITQHFPDAFYR